MADYEKLTVVKLRDELIKRGLPKTGLKAALIQRLEEADAQTASVQRVLAEPTETCLPPSVQEEHRRSQDPEPTPPSSHKESEPTGETPTENRMRSDVKAATDSTDSLGDVVKDSTIEAVEAATDERLNGTKATQDEEPLDSAIVELPGKTEVSEICRTTSDLQQEAPSEVRSGALTQPTQNSQSNIQLAAPSLAQSQEASMPLILGAEEALEDSRKRKRRSQSPPPSSVDTQKRMKADKGEPLVELPEDSTMRDGSLNERTTNNTLFTANPGQDDVLSKEDPVKLEDGVSPLKHNGAEDTKAASSPNGVAEDNVQFKPNESLIKASPSDTRFKNLFTAPSRSEISAEQQPYPDTEDRVISPAIHPATSALYIRELMRPLKPENIKDHLCALATPPDAPIDASMVTEFFLDSIRTHCLVGFATISAASRVRSGLHDRIWPNERDRRPLFVDFVPEEKLRKWIDVEHNAPSGRGHPQKKWEVVYEDENGEVKAYLQEVGTNTGGLQTRQPANADAGQGVHGAPSGPRTKDPEPRLDHAKGFQALDDLFKSTDAKPKLYYQPVSRAKAERRLEKLAAGRGGGRNDEMRRYTFEDEALVDKAPEFGNRGRGYGGRGGFSGSYRGRAGGYRGDGYRGGGESWRDRRSGY